MMSYPACCISTGARYRIIAIWGESPLSSVLYREEDVEKLLQENYRPRFEKS